MRRLELGVVLGLALAAAGVARAEPVDVPALTRLIEHQPSGLDRTAWKEQRRDAARKLAQSRDRRAAPVLIELAKTETFDVIGEIAIEGLGTLGDPSAVPVLQQIAGDPARDPTQRALARKALAKLGATAGAPPPAAAPAPDAGTAAAPRADATPPAASPEATLGGGLLGGRRGATDAPTLPALPEDTLAAFERITFALGTARLGYDTVRERLGLDFDVSGSYARRVERPHMAWGWTGDAHVVGGIVNPAGRAQTRGALVTANTIAEARFYRGAVYGVGKAAAGLQVSYLAAKDGQDPAQDADASRLAADLQVALGGGYGRVLDVGGAIRVRRLARTLDAARALGRPIDAATARKLQLTWWALRRERSAYRALVATVAILREAGVLLVEPDAGLSYEILNVLRDSALLVRPSGLDLQLVFGEGYLRRPDDDDLEAPSGEEGRVEQVLASAGYGKQLADDLVELSGTGYGRLRVFAPEAQPSPWAVGAEARVKRFTYGDHGDPFGVLEVAARIELADDDNAEGDALPGVDDDLHARIEGELGFTWWLNQASGFHLAATVAADGGELFVGAQLAATYGWLDGTFSR